MAYGIVTCANCSLNRNYAHVFSDDDSAKVNKMILIQDHFFFLNRIPNNFQTLDDGNEKPVCLKIHTLRHKVYMCVCLLDFI